MRASNMVIGCAMEGNEQASVRGFVMVNNSVVCFFPLCLCLPVNSVLRCAMKRGSKLLFIVIILLLNDHTYVVMRLIFGLKCNEFGDGILFMSRILAKSAGDETTSSHDRGEILLKTYTII